MRIKLFNDGSAFFSERVPTNDLKIEFSDDVEVYIGDSRYLTKNAIANIGVLPQGEYRVVVVHNRKKYISNESLVVTETGMICVDDSNVWRSVIALKEHIENLTKRLAEAEKIIQHHEERISGYSLFD